VDTRIGLPEDIHDGKSVHLRHCGHEHHHISQALVRVAAFEASSVREVVGSIPTGPLLAGSWSSGMILALGTPFIYRE
jgi:hypothetical protein